jgi:glycosyltransferase involved in cell wall biosynthesis
MVDQETGVFVEKGNVRDLAEAMKWLGSDDSARNALGEAARARAVREFSSSAVSAAWLEFYAAIFSASV